MRSDFGKEEEEMRKKRERIKKAGRERKREQKTRVERRKEGGNLVRI